ncbi:MAG: hypothetical protein AB7I30_17745 [Isosphaeraceae bacterium]
MRRITLALAFIVSSLTLVATTGCGGDGDTTVTQSPESKKADEIGQKGMEDFMRSKGKGAPAK